MANEIRLTVNNPDGSGEWVAVVEATDTDAVIALLVDYESAYELDDTLAPEVRLQNMLNHLVGHVEAVAQGQRQRAAAQAAQEAVDAPLWGDTPALPPE